MDIENEGVRNTERNITNNFITEQYDYESEDEKDYDKLILEDEDLIEKPLPVYKSFEGDKEIEFINYLVLEVEEKFQKITYIKLFLLYI